jgi:hypothetical protein
MELEMYSASVRNSIILDVYSPLNQMQNVSGNEKTLCKKLCRKASKKLEAARMAE